MLRGTRRIADPPGRSSTGISSALLSAPTTRMAAMTSTGAVIPTDRPILRVVTVDVHDDVDAFAHELHRGRPILDRCGIEANVRAWQATYAGADTGKVIVTLEFADFAAFARSEEAYTRATSDAEFNAWAGRLALIRSLTSDSLHSEVASAAAPDWLVP
jgi:hypothetical protein